MNKSDDQAKSHGADLSEFDPLLVAFSETVSEYRDPETGARGAAGVANVVHMNPRVLANKASLAMPEAEPTLTQTRAVMLATKDFRTLQVLNRDCGFTSVPMDKTRATGDAGLLEQYTAMEAEHGRLAQEINAALRDKKLTRAHIRQMKATLMRLIGEQEALLASLGAVAEPDPK